MTRRHRARAAAALLLCALAGAGARALAAAGGEVEVERRTGRLLAGADLAPAFPPDLGRHLASGLTNVIAIHAALLPERGGEPLALDGREIDVLYDVWEETYGVTVKDRAHPRGERRVFADAARLREFLADARGLDLGPAAALGGGAFVVQLRVEVNPVSKELLERTREFISNPSSSRVGGGPSRSVLGAMASYLLQRADPGSDVRFFQSRPFTAREVPAR
ncbi:hypothetical protein [Anaeromyxobacter paludicola]|uniref:Uncharacterized protein n=1 Tax=Anaeromyxobacter paludicola TaxID=2918171 RepID=A0ABM7X934_9BACT|nr:hypothetical protein [Anaeromyxobacter paludicola]BDG08347.1 hypothetical protein AMPC_14600 [Anaeromyxobacter paludicola]